MNIRFLAAGALAIGISHAAHATVYFNSTTVTNPSAGSDGQPDSNTYMAASFTAANLGLSQLSLTLLDATPSDTGSMLVYLVPDNGVGGSNGLAGAPVTTAPPVSELIGTISDSSLLTTPSLKTIFFSPSAASLATSDQEYWIELEPSSTSQATWEYGTNDTGGTGLAGQSSVDSFFPTVAPDTLGTYDMIVATPEPASMAILGGGLASLGFFRRRVTKKA